MNRRIHFLVLLVALIVASCSSPSRLIKNQDYDQAIEKLSRKMRGGKVKQDDVMLLKQAYHVANQQDHDRIRLLGSSGRADVWPEVLHRYEKMNYRQSLVKTLPFDVQQSIAFVPLNLDAEITEARTRAVDHLKKRADALLASGSKGDARKAFSVLSELKTVYPEYPDIDRMLRNALLQGTNQVLIMFENQTGLPLPQEFEKEVMNLSTREFDQEYVQFDLVEKENVDYDYVVYISLKQILVSPEKIDTRRFTEKKEIEDGKQPKRDTEGRIMLDSTGKVIEVTRYRTVEAFVNETVMSKSALLKGSVDFVETASRRALHSAPFETASNFIHSYAVVNGDLRAATKETLEMMKRGPAPFPPDGAMVMEGARQLNPMLRNIIRKEARIVRQAQ